MELPTNSSSNISYGLANMLSILMESFAYGINFATFYTCMGALLMHDGQLRTRRNMNFLMISAAIALFFIASLDMGVMFDYNIMSFIEKDPRTDSWLSGITNWWGAVEYCNLIIQAFIGDSILIFRCFVLWGRRWSVISIPTITTLVGTACGLVGVAIGTKGDENTSRSKIEPYIISMLVLTLITNAISSSLIVYRIWSISKESSRYRTNPSQDPSPKAIRVTVEAGLLYTTTMVVMTTLYLLGHNAYVPITRVIVQIIGITFNLVIIRSIRRPEEVYMVPCIRTMVTTEIIVTRDVHTVSDSDHSRDVEKESVKKDDW